MAHSSNSSRISSSINKGKLPIVVISGRPNVGKSSLYNILSRTQDAMVAPEAGITRDSRFVDCDIEGLQYTLTDTAGIELGEDGMASLLNEKVKDTFEIADIIVFVVDGQSGIIEADRELANYIRSINKPVILVVNKADTKEAQTTVYEAYEFGFGEAVQVSAAHRQNMDELDDALVPVIEKMAEERGLSVEASDEDEPNRPLPLAIVGRPNAGKSTLVNALLDEDRMLTGDLAGLTRESVGSIWEVDGQLIELVDTPGIRRKAKVVEHVEKMSVSDAFGAVERAHSVILVLDATCPFEKQDAILADKIVAEGKPVVIALNKWDLIKDKEAVLEELQHQLKVGFHQVKKMSIIPISALNKKGLEKLMPEVRILDEKWKKRIGTGELNRFIDMMVTENHPPIRGGRPLKIKFMSQIGACPPTFALFVNRPKDFPESYVRYIANGLREVYDYNGVIIRVVLRSTENPYANKKKSND